MDFYRTPQELMIVINAYMVIFLMSKWAASTARATIDEAQFRLTTAYNVRFSVDAYLTLREPEIFIDTYVVIF